MFKKYVLFGFFSLALAGGAVACERHTARTEVAQKNRELADKLDHLENEWIRLKAQAQGKSKAEQELAVLKDEIEEELTDARKKLESFGNGAEKEGAKAKESLEKAIESLERSIKKAKNDLG